MRRKAGDTSIHFTILFSLPVWQSVGLIFLLMTSSSQTLRVPLQPKQCQETEALDAALAMRMTGQVFEVQVLDYWRLILVSELFLKDLCLVSVSEAFLLSLV